jgi:putative toxin-antitoxin system antitoxin component (TIGR02293 family)
MAKGASITKMAKNSRSKVEVATRVAKAKRSGVPASFKASGSRPKKIYTEGNEVEHLPVSGKDSIKWERVLMSASAEKPESQMTSLEKMEATRAGISKKELERLKLKAALDYDQLAYILGVARATLINKKGSERFSPMLSEKIMNLADIYSYGYEVFGDQQEFNKWIFQPIAALGGKSPYDLLDNQYGREEVKNVIGRIDYGVYS